MEKKKYTNSKKWLSASTTIWWIDFISIKNNSKFIIIIMLHYNKGLASTTERGRCHCCNNGITTNISRSTYGRSMEIVSAGRSKGG